MIDLIFLALCFVGVLFILSTVIAETFILKVLKWGNFRQSFGITILMNTVSTLVVICNVLIFGTLSSSINTGTPIVSVSKRTATLEIYPQQNEDPDMAFLPSESQEPIIFSSAWNAVMFGVIVVVEWMILFFASLTRSVKTSPNKDQAPVWKTLLRADFLSLCANAASFAIFSACKASSGLWM